MASQQEEILKMIVALKAIKLPVSTVEKDLKFSNGLLGKAGKGTTELSEDKFQQFEKYFKEKTGVQEPVKTPTQMVVTEKGIKDIPSTEKKLLVTESMAKINKDFGDGTIMFFGDKPQTGYTVISTGSLLLDEALGIKGVPLGRMVEIFGLESSGKTTIALNVIANGQKMGLGCLLVDAENAFDPEYAEALGVDIEKLRYCQPSCGEEGLEVADREICSGKVGVVVIDSVAALVPKAELEGAHGDSKMGLHARLMSQACRKLVSSISKNNVVVIFINQIRNKIGITYGSPEVTTGGMALQFYASIRMRVSRSISAENSVINNGITQGNLTTVKVLKNKCAPPFKSAQFDILYGTGIDRLGEVIDLAVTKGVIQKAGSWFSYLDSKLGQGKESVRACLKDNPELALDIENKLK